MSRERYYPVNPAVPPPDDMIPFDPIRQKKTVFLVDDDLLFQEKARSTALFKKSFR